MADGAALTAGDIRPARPTGGAGTDRGIVAGGALQSESDISHEDRAGHG